MDTFVFIRTVSRNTICISWFWRSLQPKQTLLLVHNVSWEKSSDDLSSSGHLLSTPLTVFLVSQRALHQLIMKSFHPKLTVVRVEHAIACRKYDCVSTHFELKISFKSFNPKQTLILVNKNNPCWEYSRVHVVRDASRDPSGSQWL